VCYRSGGVFIPGIGGLMAERERRQMEEILHLDLEELNVEVVDDEWDEDDDDSVDAFLRVHKTTAKTLSPSLFVFSFP
jgi:cereblon